MNVGRTLAIRGIGVVFHPFYEWSPRPAGQAV